MSVNDTINTKVGYQLLGNPPESYKSKAGGGKIMKIVGDESDLSHLKDWYGKVEILQARLAMLDDDGSIVRNAYAHNNLAEIPELAETVVDMIEGINNRIGKHLRIWWEIAPIMPVIIPRERDDGTLTSWIGEWNATVAEMLAARGIRSVCFGFATGTPQVKPFAGVGDHGPDEWHALYPALKRLNKLGKKWVRIGVEEYITGGRLNPLDFSNVGRILFVYQNHFVPNGWLDLLFRGIEGSFDLPGRADVEWMTPVFFWEQMALVDRRYATMPYIDAMALYAVCDPVNNENESSFAITPGDRHEPKGYLERGQEYFEANPPSAGPIELPPTVPPVEPPAPAPEPAEVTLFDMKLTYRVRSLPGDDRGDRKMPLDENGDDLFFYGWIEPDDKISHVELYPPPGTGYDKPWALRIQNQAPRVKFWFARIFETKPGDVLKVLAHSKAEIKDATGEVIRNIIVDPAGGRDPARDGLRSGEVRGTGEDTAELTITATGERTTIFWQTFCKVPARINVDYDVVTVKRTRLAQPPTPAPSGPGKARTRKRVNGWLPNMRDAASPEANLLYEGLPEGRDVTLTGNAANGYSEIIGALVLDEDEPALKRMGWIPTDGLQRVP